MSTLELTLCARPSREQRVQYVEKVVSENPDDLDGWLYLADHTPDLNKSIEALWQIERIMSQHVAEG